MYKTVKIKTSSNNQADAKVLVIYTGGTLGMVYDKKSDSLVPFDFTQIPDNLPEMARLEFEITVLTFDQLLDSSNMKPSVWADLARIIGDNYEKYDSFVILHGTDTMAYSASALSYLLENLNKPVIFTGAQLPIGVARTDAKENFITALEIAAARQNGRPLVPEVCVFFHSMLLRGNRSKKQESAQFNAFQSENYPALAEAGIYIEYNHPFIKHYKPNSSLRIHERLDENVVILKLFPGISEKIVHNILSINGLKGVVLETYGSGNAPTDEWFLNAIKKAIENGIVIFNVSQCNGGRVTQGRYQTSKVMQEIGVVSGSDITTEAAITKMMFAFGQTHEVNEVKAILAKPFSGEMS
ncbi:L-asparaginase [Pseudarcicella hirudinis]|uniref:asparaginase n=1 Tax=Pseudarcicella hirudinis TaxID=1079859 RepID=A0A1I5Y271_9BACT|nr:asparaginase [Pseudarcicella hirudinis]SFQ38200.1 L-asparaginase [Pseudarcicella hirudinis]